MKRAKFDMIISFVILVSSLIIMVIMQFHCLGGVGNYLRLYISPEVIHDFRELILAISTGFFSGSVLAFLIAIKDYNIERKNALEELYFSILEIQKKLYQIDFLMIEEPVEIVKAVLLEEEKNQEVYKYNEQLIDLCEEKSKKKRKKILKEHKKKYCSKSRDTLKNYLWKRLDENQKKEIEKRNQKEYYLNKMANQKVEEYRSCCEKSINSYISLKDISTERINNAINCIDFLKDNDLKSSIHSNLYMKVFMHVQLVKQCGKMFHDYNSQYNGLAGKTIDLLVDCQTFFIDKNQADFYYNRYAYEIECELWKLLEITNGTNLDMFPQLEWFSCSSRLHLGSYKEKEKDNNE